MNAQNYIANIIAFVNDVVIPFILGVAFLIFVINVFRYFILGGANADSQEKARSVAIYSVAAFVFIIIFWGVVNLFAGSLGFEDCNQPAGDYVSQRFIGPNLPDC